MIGLLGFLRDPRLAFESPDSNQPDGLIAMHAANLA